MARIKLDILNPTIATFIIPVRITDLNYGNHVGNDAFVSIIHEARMKWLHSYFFMFGFYGGEQSSSWSL